MPAPRPSLNYVALLDRIHCALRPRTYVEIGVQQGRSLSLALPGTSSIGIDPSAQIRFPVGPTTQVFEATSDDFFSRHDLVQLLGGPVDLAFIDGMHLFEFALRDFMAIERWCHPDSTVLLHDCNPVDERTSARVREGRGTWSGDIWKVIVCLREYRPDLHITTVDVPPTGLGVITGLDPASTVLAERYDEIVERFTPLGYAALGDRDAALNLVADDWNAIRPHLPAVPYRTANAAGLVCVRAARWRRRTRLTVHRDIRMLLALAHADRATNVVERVATAAMRRSRPALASHDFTPKGT